MQFLLEASRCTNPGVYHLELVDLEDQHFYDLGEALLALEEQLPGEESPRLQYLSIAEGLRAYEAETKMTMGLRPEKQRNWLEVLARQQTQGIPLLILATQEAGLESNSAEYTTTVEQHDPTVVLTGCLIQTGVLTFCCCRWTLCYGHPCLWSDECAQALLNSHKETAS